MIVVLRTVNGQRLEFVRRDFLGDTFRGGEHERGRALLLRFAFRGRGHDLNSTLLEKSQG